MSKIKLVNKLFLDDYKLDFSKEYIHLYRLQNKNKIKEIFSQTGVLSEEDIDFSYEPLCFKQEEGGIPSPEIAFKNAQILWRSLGFLTPKQAESECLWVGLAHTYYLDYHLHFIRNAIDKSIVSNTLFVNGKKRSLAIHSLAHLWWLSYYFLDENSSDPWKYVRLILGQKYRGNLVVLLSSNFVTNKNIALGLAETLGLLSKQGYKVNRQMFAEACVLLNQVGSVRILDALEQKEITEILVDKLPKILKA